MIGSTEGLKAFAENNAYSFPDEDLPVMLRQANMYLRGINWKGDPVLLTQPDIFPRVVEDFETGAQSVVELPDPVVQFAYMIACDAAEQGIALTSSAGGGKVTMERVEGAIQVQYSEASLFEDGFSADYMNNMIGPWINYAARGASLPIYRS